MDMWLHAHARDLAGASVAAAFVYGFLHPVLGVQMMASSTMYGNVKNYGGGNHLIVPTGLLQDYLAGTPATVSDFAGGFVRVEHTTSPSLSL